MDQANRLRDLVQRRNTAGVAKPVMNARMITVTSGKGGVGKSNFTVNLAIHLRKLNKRVIIIDADFGLANIEVLFGMNPKYNVADVLAGIITIEGALTIGPLGVMFLSGGSGITALSDITERQMTVLIESFLKLDSMADIFLIDTGAGLSKSVINFIKATGEAIIVTTPDPTSVTDAYALIKTVKDGASELPEFNLVVNRAESPEEATDVYEKLSTVCDRFLGIQLHRLGNIPYDQHLVKAVKRQQPVSLLYPNAESSLCISAICNKLLNIAPAEKKKTIFSFVSKLVGKLGG